MVSMSCILRSAGLILAFQALVFAPPSLATHHDLFDDADTVDGGWQGLANVLKTLEPRVDTRLPLSASQITDRIRSMIDHGEYEQALVVIRKREEQRQHDNALGEDVQLQFLKARAQALSGAHKLAVQTYLNMTIHFPELPEPWNNLATEYVRLGQLQRAEQALQTALANDPDYTEARFNLGMVQLMLAHDSLNHAARLGSGQAKHLAEQTGSLLGPR